MNSVSAPSIEVCLSPSLLHLFDTKGKAVVIIDVFRATSTIAAALDNGAASVIPVDSVQHCIELGQKVDNSITAGERNGQVAEGLQHGNSPSEYPKDFIEGKNLVLTTTNGTRLLHMVKGAEVIITGSFVNLSAVCNYLIKRNIDVILGCAGWKDRFNLEDSLFAGAVVHQIKQHFSVNCDSAMACEELYLRSKETDTISFLRNSSHYKRLSVFGLEYDMEYCATHDKHPVVPILQGEKLVINK